MQGTWREEGQNVELFVCSIQLHGKNLMHSYDILGARMLWKPKEARILKNF